MSSSISPSHVYMANRASKVAEAAGAESARIWADVYIGGALLTLGHLDEGMERMDAAHREAAERGLVTIAGNALYNASIFRIRTFRAREALERMPLFEPLRIGGQPLVLELFASGTAWFYLGYPARARDMHEQALVLARENQSHTFARWISRELGTSGGAHPNRGSMGTGPPGPNGRPARPRQGRSRRGPRAAHEGGGCVRGGRLRDRGDADAPQPGRGIHQVR